jgi:hypothetical protein
MPQKRACGYNGFTGSNADYISSSLRVNHYASGALEARGRDRRQAHTTFTRFQERNIDPVSIDNYLRPWFEWFLEEVGQSDAKRLLVGPLNELFGKFAAHPFVVMHRSKITKA